MWLNNLTHIFAFIGGAGLFYFGVKVLSNRQQELFDPLLHGILRGLKEKGSSSYFRGVIFSLLSCSTIGSSSTIIGLVNAGLIRFRTGLGLIAGANVGSPIIALGLSLIEPRLGLVFLGLGVLPYFFRRQPIAQALGGAFFGVGLILLGESFVATSFSSLSFVSLLHHFPQISGLFVGLLLSLLFRSSLVSMAVIFSIAPLKLLPTEQLFFMVLGINLGAAIPAFFSGRGGNILGQRISHSHFLFNILVVILGFVTWHFFPSFYNNLPSESAWSWALIHLGLNVCISFVFLIFEKAFSQLIIKLVPDELYQEPYELEVLGQSLDMIPALALTQARFHLQKLVDVVNRLFLMTGEYILADEVSARTLAKIKDYERIADNMHEEMDSFLEQLTVNSLSANQAQQVQIFSRTAQELEAISDYIDSLATKATQLKEEGFLTGQLKAELSRITEEVQRLYFGVITHNSVKDDPENEKIFARGRELKEEIHTMVTNSIEELSKMNAPARVMVEMGEVAFSLRKIRGLTLKVYKCFIEFGS